MKNKAPSEVVEQSAPASPASPTSPTKKPLWRNPLVIGIAASVVLAIGGGTWWYFSRTADADTSKQASQEQPVGVTAKKAAPAGETAKAESSPPQKEVKGEANPMDVKTEKPEANSDTRVTVVAKTLDGVTVNASIEIPLGDDKKADLKKYFPYLKQAFSRYIGSAKANALGSRENRTELIMILSEVANEELPPNLRVKEIVLIQLDINAQGPAQ